MITQGRLAGLLGPEPADNACRFMGGQGHIESWFIRANDPARPRAFWLKQTILAPLDAPPVAESWFIWFDGERKLTIAQRVTQPLREASLAAAGIHTRSMSMNLGASGHAKGEVEAPEGRVRFDISWRAETSPVAEPLSILPWKLLRVGPFPKSKLLTPFPSLRFGGSLELPGESVDIDGWYGMQGHNWGKEHAFEYAWGQCLFPDEDAMVEGFSARVRIGGRTTPRLSALVVRRGARSYRFDRIFDAWLQQATVEDDRWTLTIRGDAGEAALSMDASKQPMVCLGYDNPSGEHSYCYNSKLAAVELVVRPSDGASFSLRSAHGGALEFLRRQPDPRFPRVV